jgi:hypothetical protein
LTITLAVAPKLESGIARNNQAAAAPISVFFDENFIESLRWDARLRHLFPEKFKGTNGALLTLNLDAALWQKA